MLKEISSYYTYLYKEIQRKVMKSLLKATPILAPKFLEKDASDFFMLHLPVQGGSEEGSEVLN